MHTEWQSVAQANAAAAALLTPTSPVRCLFKRTASCTRHHRREQLWHAAAWSGERVELLEALRGEGMLPSVRGAAQGRSSPQDAEMVALIELADVVVASSVASGGKTTVLLSPQTCVRTYSRGLGRRAY